MAERMSLLWRPLEEVLGRLRKERKAGVFRQRSSGSVLMVWRYACRPMRRDSARAGEEVVEVK